MGNRLYKNSQNQWLEVLRCQRGNLCLRSNRSDLSCYWQISQEFLDFRENFKQRWQSLPFQEPGVPDLEPAPGQIPGLNFIPPWNIMGHVHKYLRPIIDGLFCSFMEESALALMDKSLEGMTCASWRKVQNLGPDDNALSSIALSYRALLAYSKWATSSQQHLRLLFCINAPVVIC